MKEFIQGQAVRIRLNSLNLREPIISA